MYSVAGAGGGEGVEAHSSGNLTPENLYTCTIGWEVVNNASRVQCGEGRGMKNVTHVQCGGEWHTGVKNLSHV